MQRKAQGAIEYLLIIGAAVIIAVIVIALMMGLAGQGTQATEEAGLGKAYSSLYAQKEKTGYFYILFGETFSKGSGLAKDLDSVYHFEAPAGSTVSEDSAGKIEWTCDPSYCPTFGEPGAFGTAALFDGTKTYLENTDFVAQINQTVSVWVKPSIGMGTTGTNKAYYVFGNNSNKGYGYLGPRDGYKDFILYICNYNVDSRCGGEYDYHGTGSMLEAGKWYQLTFVTSIEEDKFIKKLYINGELKATRESTIIEDLTFSTHPGARMGASVDRYGYFNGLIDELIIWDRPLGDDEVAELYALASERG